MGGVLLCIAACSPQQKTPEKTFTAEKPPVYDYPIRNPYAATIITVPPEMKLDYSDVPDPENKTLTLFEDREIPEGFWYENGLRYSQLLQDHAAPLVYVIAGTGADHRAEKMRTLGNILYSAGFHVVLLPSPTHQNFIINASSNFIVGRPRQSAQDLYRVMRTIDREVTRDVTVTERMLTGYSLGGLDAAFTAKLDDEQHALNFSRVLLINPPYGLYSSIKVISAMLYQDLPNGIDDADGFIKNAMKRMSSVNQSGDALDFQNERLLMDAYEKYPPSDAKLATTIGLSFRISAASMAFAADVMSHAGYVFPKDKEFTTGSDLKRSMSLALRTSFEDYFNELYIRRIHETEPTITRDQLVAESNLEHLGGYIRGNPKFGLITNTDDVILAPGEVDRLASMFGANAYVFDSGGHVGNLGHPAVAYTIAHFMQQGSVR